MNMIDWYKRVVFENYANFSGRARRSEYWYFYLANILIAFVLSFSLGVVIAMSNGEFSGIMDIVVLFYNLAVLIPSLAVAVRRMHDIGKSGWNVLFFIIPLIGIILMLLWFTTESEPRTNKWGPNPKAPNDDIDEIGQTKTFN